MEKNMNIKPILFNTLLATLTFISPTLVSASETALRVAVIKDSIASHNILSGDWNTSIIKLSRRNMAHNTFERYMGLCVAYLKNKNNDRSEVACTTAIESLTSANLKNDHTLYLKAIAYSNRGVARYLKNDLTGAISDLSVAKSMNNNSITEGNFEFIERIYSEVNNKI
jgi:hypothetical protein